MLDRAAATLIKPAIDRLARVLADHGMGANRMTVLGFGIGIGAALLIAYGCFLAGAAAILLSRLCEIGRAHV